MVCLSQPPTFVFAVCCPASSLRPKTAGTTSASGILMISGVGSACKLSKRPRVTRCTQIPSRTRFSEQRIRRLGKGGVDTECVLVRRQRWPYALRVAPHRPIPHSLVRAFFCSRQSMVQVTVWTISLPRKKQDSFHKHIAMASCNQKFHTERASSQTVANAVATPPIV